MRCANCGQPGRMNLRARRKIRHKEELEVAVNRPVLGLLPQVARRHHGDGILVLDSPNSAAGDAYRTLRNSLQFMALGDQPLGCVQVTSPNSGEGKTTVVTNLAVSFARARQRVIILDCNLRQPRVQEAFGLSNERGFTSVLLDQCPLAEAVITLEKEPYLAILTAGPVPPNPSELLNSDRAKAVLATLRDNCDLLLIDTPPVLPVVDALVISKYVDACLLVARPKRTTRREITRADELLRQVKAPLVGTVFNGVKDDGYGYGYTGYSGGGPTGPADPPPEGGPPAPGGGQPPSAGGGPSSDRAPRRPLGPPDKSGHLAKAAPEPDPQTAGLASPGPTGTRSSRVKAGTR